MENMFLWSNLQLKGQDTGTTKLLGPQLLYHMVWYKATEYRQSS